MVLGYDFYFLPVSDLLPLSKHLPVLVIAKTHFFPPVCL